jgi:Fic family protein
VRELLNYRRAFEFVSKYLEDGGPITEGLVREIHKHLVEGVRGGAAALREYRKIHLHRNMASQAAKPRPSASYLSMVV